MRLEEPRILIVDDNADLAYLLKKFFLSQGFRVYLAIDGAQAVEWIQNMKMDVVLTDLLMEKMDGLELVKKIRDLQPSALCFMMTGYYEKEQVEQALFFGVREVFVKPFDSFQVLARIREGLQSLF